MQQFREVSRTRTIYSTETTTDVVCHTYNILISEFSTRSVLPGSDGPGDETAGRRHQTQGETSRSVSSGSAACRHALVSRSSAVLQDLGNTSVRR